MQNDINMKQNNIEGLTLENQNNNANNVDIDETLKKEFIGENYEKLIRDKRFNFSAFFFSVFYLFYRKLTLYGIILIIINFIISSINSILTIIPNLLLGIFFNKLYLYYVDKKINELKQKNKAANFETIIEECKRKGGTSLGSIFIGILLYLVIAIIFVVFSLLLNIPSKFNIKLKDNKQKNNEIKTKIENGVLTGDYKIAGKVSYNNNAYYTIYVKDIDAGSLIIHADEFNLPDNLISYNEEIKLRIVYDINKDKILDCKVSDNYGNIIKDVSKKNIEKLFDPEYNKKVIKKELTKSIKLSSLKENVVYKYDVKNDTSAPEIINDTGYDCIVYEKNYETADYEKNVMIYKKIEGFSITTSHSSLSKNDVYSILYKKASVKELMDILDKDDVINLSNYKSGDSISQQFEKYIYNDTSNKIEIHAKDTFYEETKENTYKINPGEIYRLDLGIDSIVIKY